MRIPAQVSGLLPTAYGSSEFFTGIGQSALGFDHLFGNADMPVSAK
ncbi:MAG: hypothetical protein K6G15_04205 [Desulfovibrio sp.]|nr:hypothetical protein [Desulfovibrio sp.]